MITQQRLKELLNYDPETGIFTWVKRTSNRVKIGDAVGFNSHGYVRMKVDGTVYGAGPLAWFYMTGRWPSHEIDHKNTIRNDNRWDNLRDIPHTVNLQNIRRAHRDSKSMLGTQQRENGRWSAKICINKKQIPLGTFDTEAQAHAAYVEAKRRIHEGCTL